MVKDNREIATCLEPTRTVEAQLLLLAAMQVIARLIVLPATLNLLEEYGGLRPCACPLARGSRESGCCTTFPAYRLGGRTASSPALCRDPALCANCKPVLLRARDVALLRGWQRLSGEGLSERRIVQCLALRYHLTERHIWTIFKKPQANGQSQLLQQGNLI